MPPGLRSRAHLLQVLLAVGAVLVVTGAWALAAGSGDAAIIPLLSGAALAAGLSGWAASAGLRSTEETLAACAVGLALIASAWGGTLRSGSVLPPAGVAAACFLVSRVAGTTAAWPLGSWFAGQLAVLRLLPDVPRSLHAVLLLAVALTGLAIAIGGRRLVARTALVTTGPWWIAGVVTGTATAWTATGAERELAALLMVGAAAGLLPARLRAELDPLLGPPVAVPLVSGVVAGVAVSGALAAFGTPGITAAGYAGVLIASTVPEFLTGWRRVFRPVAVAGGSTMAGAALVQLSAGAHWAALSLLLLLTAAPTAVVAWFQPEERRSAVPTAVGCLAGAVLLAVPAAIVDPATGALLLTVLYAAGLGVAMLLPADARRPTVVAAAASAAAAAALTVGHRDLTALALVLVVQGLIGVGWGGWTAFPDPDRPPSAAWRIGAAELILAAEIAAHDSGVRVFEAYSLPVAAGLLLGAGPRLVRGRSWPAWGPGLLVAAVPSGVLAVLAPGSTRPVLVLAVAAAVMVAAGVFGVRAPLMIGGGTAVAVALGLAVEAQLWPLTGALVLGAALLAVGARREEFPVAWFGARLADLR